MVNVADVPVEQARRDRLAHITCHRVWFYALNDNDLGLRQYNLVMIVYTRDAVRRAADALIFSSSSLSNSAFYGEYV